MNPEIKQKWIDALRSGKYNQTKSNLKSKNGFCSLGVLVDLYLLEKNLDWKLYVDHSEFNGRDSHLYNRVITWYDVIIWANGSNYFDVCNLLIKMNDQEEKTFQEIADFIEENV
jgi:hypothetical protein